MSESSTLRLIRLMSAGKGASREWLAQENHRQGLDAFIARLKRALSLMPDDPYTAAIKVAINIDQELPTGLEQRRLEYLASANKKVSYRTLIRHERRGAELLANLYDRLEAQDEEAPTVETLEQRIAELQQELSDAQSVLTQLKSPTTDL